MRQNKAEMPKIVALTGGIGSGKSLALKFFKDRGCTVLNADEIAKKLLDMGGSAYEEALALFGRAIMLDGGELSKAGIAEIVFRDSEMLASYKSMLKPHIERAIDEEIKKSVGMNTGIHMVVIEAPVLFEYGMEDYPDYIVLITADMETRIARVMARNNMSRAEVEARMASQIPDEFKREGADFVIDNSGTMEELEMEIAELIVKLEGLSLC